MISYVTNLIHNLLRRGVAVTLIGVQGESSTLPYRIEMIPLGRYGQVDSWSIWVKLWGLAARAKLPPDAVLHAQKTLDILPFCVLKPRVPKVLTVHGDHRGHIASKYGGTVGALYGFLERIAFRFTGRVVFVSRELHDSYSKRIRPRKEGDYLVLPPGVDEAVFHPASKGEARARFGLGGGVVLGFSGRFAPEKRIDLLLETFRRFKQKHGPAELLLVGPTEANLHGAGIKDPRSSGIRATGMLRRDQVAQALAAMDVFVLTSDREGLPIALLEAVAAGVPVVTRDVGDVRQVITDGDVGYVVASSDPDAIAEAIAKAVKLRISDETRKAAVGRFSWERIGLSLVGVYEQLLRESHVHIIAGTLQGR